MKRGPFQDFLKYLKVTLKQFPLNIEYSYFWLLGVVVHIGILQTCNLWVWGLVALLDLAVGILGVASIVRRVDLAFESIGLNFERGYGKPRWIISEKHPAKSDILRIYDAGYTPKDYQTFLEQIAARLRHPIKDIQKPSAHHPIIEVRLRKTEIPSLLRFENLPVETLRSGEFFVGQSDDKLEKLSLSEMIHMLVAGKTGGGKTYFLRQVLTSLLLRTREIHIAIIDLKGGVDFQQLNELGAVEGAYSYKDANILIEEAIALFEKRREYLIKQKKSNWNELKSQELLKTSDFKGLPIGPVVIVIDELAELSKQATKNTEGQGLQEKISTLARLSRVTGIHLIIGTQRPDKSIIDMQIKDNLQTRICFSVPSVSASTLVVGDMSATTLGDHQGRAIYQIGTSKIVQTPFLTTSTLRQKLETLHDSTSGKSKRSLMENVRTEVAAAESKRGTIK